jgi:hypothetical protein
MKAMTIKRLSIMLQCMRPLLALSGPSPMSARVRPMSVLGGKAVAVRPMLTNLDL